MMSDEDVFLERVQNTEDEAPFDRDMWAQFYQRLKAQARRRLVDWKGGSTISATVLVHEVFIKLESSPKIFKNKGHFLSIISLAMRQILVEYIRKKSAQKRGSFAVTLDDFHSPQSNPQMDLLALDRVLDQVRSLDERLAQIVEARVFGGFTLAEIAEALEISPRTADRLWAKARILLTKLLQE